MLRRRDLALQRRQRLYHCDRGRLPSRANSASTRSPSIAPPTSSTSPTPATSRSMTAPAALLYEFGDDRLRRRIRRHRDRRSGDGLRLRRRARQGRGLRGARAAAHGHHRRRRRDRRHHRHPARHGRPRRQSADRLPLRGGPRSAVRKRRIRKRHARGGIPLRAGRGLDPGRLQPARGQSRHRRPHAPTRPTTSASSPEPPKAPPTATTAPSPRRSARRRSPNSQPKRSAPPTRSSAPRSTPRAPRRPTTSSTAPPPPTGRARRELPDRLRGRQQRPHRQRPHRRPHPGTAYHFRFVATSLAGEAQGEDTTFATYLCHRRRSAPAPTKQFRTGFGARLPDCRAYEQASPVDKHGANVQGTSGAVQASSTGDRATFYLTRRPADQRRQLDSSPPTSPRAAPAAGAPTASCPCSNRPRSPTSSAGATTSPRPSTKPRRPAAATTYYLRDSATGAYQLIGHCPAGGGAQLDGYAADTSHLIFEAHAPSSPAPPRARATSTTSTTAPSPCPAASRSPRRRAATTKAAPPACSRPKAP